MKIDNEILLNYYALGFEMSSDDQEILDWFEYDHEKLAYMIGYSDFDLGITREPEEIIEEVKNRL